jgi:hypothetical protein
MLAMTCFLLVIYQRLDFFVPRPFGRGHARLVHLGMQLAPPHGAGPQPLRPHQHHHDEQNTVDEQPELDELAQQLRQADEHERAQNNARQAAHAADDDDRQDVDGNEQFEAVGEDGTDARTEDGPRQPGEARADGEGQQLGAHQVDAHRLGHVFVLAHGHPLPPGAAVAQPPGDEQGQHTAGQDEVVVVLGGDKGEGAEVGPANVQNALCAADDRL